MKIYTYLILFHTIITAILIKIVYKDDKKIKRF